MTFKNIINESITLNEKDKKILSEIKEINRKYNTYKKELNSFYNKEIEPLYQRIANMENPIEEVGDRLSIDLLRKINSNIFNALNSLN